MSEYDAFLSMYGRPAPVRVDRPEPPAIETMPEVAEPLTTEQLAMDPTFQHHAQRWIEKASGRYGPVTPLETPEDYARAALDRLSWFRTNMGSMLMDYSRLARADVDTVRSFLAVYDAYDRAPTEAEHVIRGAVQSMVDPFNIVGLAFVGGAVKRGLSSAAIRHHLRSRLVNAAAALGPAMATAAAEGAIFAGADAAVMEAAAARGEGREMNRWEPARGAMFGAMAGAGLGALATGAAASWPAVSRGARHLYDQVVHAFRNIPVASGVVNAVGVGRFADTEDIARLYDGEQVVSADVVTRNPVVFDEIEVSAEALGERIALSSDQVAALQAEIGEGAVPITAAMDSPAVIEALRSRGVDYVRYPEGETWTGAALDAMRLEVDGGD